MHVYKMRSLLLLAILATVSGQSSQIIGSLPNCSQEFLFAVTQENDGVGLSIFYNDDAYTVTSGNHLQLTLQGQQLSKECGVNYIRCKDPLTVTTPLNATSVQHLAFIPLTGGLQIVKLVQTGLFVEFGEKIFLDTTESVSVACNPVKAFLISYDYYFACVDSQQNYIAMHRIHVNKTVLRNSWTSNSPFAELDIPETEDMQTLSNFVYFREGAPVEMVIFAVGNCMYAFDIVAYLVQNEYEGIGNNCTHVKYLEYIGNYRFVAYCEFTNVVYNVQYEEWEKERWNEQQLEGGVPYTCPNRTIQLTVFPQATYLKYSINSLVGDIDFLGEGFDNGVCFAGAGSTTLFAYSDLQTGVYIVNMTTFEVLQVVSTSCETNGCLSIDLMNNRYLVVREIGPNKQQLRILDAQNNLAPVITVDHYSPVLFSYLNGTNELSNCGGPVISLDERSNAAAIAGSLVVSVVFVLLAIIAVAVFIAVKIKRRRRLAYPTQVADRDSGQDVEKVIPGAERGDDTRVSELTHPQQPVNGAIQMHNTSMLTKPPTAEPIEEKDPSSPCQQVGNGDSPPSAITSYNDNEHIFGASRDDHIPMQNLATVRPTHKDRANSPPVDFLGMNKPVQSGSVFSDTPKLAVAEDNDREKGAAEDNQLENSLSSTSVDDDEAPLLNE